MVLEPDSYSRLLQTTSPQNVESLVSATLGREALGFADQCRVGAAFLGLEQLARLHGSHLARAVGDALSDSGVGARFQELLQRCDAAASGLEQTLQMLARVDQPARAQDPLLVDDSRKG